MEAFPAEDRTFGGNTLFVDLIPSSCWMTNVRYCLSQRDWNIIRKRVYRRAGHACEACGSPGNVEAHERWQYESQPRRVQKLVRLVALCHSCHEATHMGLARIKGRGEAAKRHLSVVTGLAGEALEQHIADAFSLWSERNEFDWELDISMLTDAGFEVIRPVNTQDRRHIGGEVVDPSRSAHIGHDRHPPSLHELGRGAGAVAPSKRRMRKQPPAAKALVLPE